MGKDYFHAAFLILGFEFGYLGFGHSESRFAVEKATVETEVDPTGFRFVVPTGDDRLQASAPSILDTLNT